MQAGNHVYIYIYIYIYTKYIIIMYIYIIMCIYIYMCFGHVGMNTYMHKSVVVSGSVTHEIQVNETFGPKQPAEMADLRPRGPFAEQKGSAGWTKAKNRGRTRDSSLNIGVLLGQ